MTNYRLDKIIRRFSITCFSILISFQFCAAQSILGTWSTIDDTDGQQKSHIEVYEENGKVYGKVIKLLPAADITHCDECKGDKKGKPIEGMIIMNDLIKDGDGYSDGEILDPATGKVYSCFIELESADKLKVRGYLGFALIGRSQYWMRVK